MANGDRLIMFQKCPPVSTAPREAAKRTLYVAKCDRVVTSTYGTHASYTTIYGTINIWIKKQPKSQFPHSRKKIEANGRNAQLSTGPKSLEGKKIVAGNARKHGLLANNVVILTGDGKEDQAEFDGLLFQLHEYYKPVGVARTFWFRKLQFLTGEARVPSVVKEER